MVVRIQSRHDIVANWNKENPTLLVGEIGVETDGNKRMKIGNGIDAWQNLPYFDEKFIHTYGEDIIEGLKQFNDNITIGTVAKNANLDVKGNVTVSGKVEGLATSAIGDEDGNSIKDCYQKLLSKELEVDDTIDWNDLNDTGVYLVNVSSWKLDGTLHQPAIYNQYMSRQGLVHVIVDKDGDILQVYTAMKKHASTTVMTQLYRYYKDSAWCDWKSIVAEDDSIVHRTGEESVAGVKSFTDTVNVKDINFTTEANIKMNNQTFLKKNASGDTVLSANGNVILRPNGTTSATGQVVIGADGVLDGKCLRDSAGRVIEDTYATKDNLKHNSSVVLEPDFISRSEDEDAYKVLVDRMNNGLEFDKSKFTIVGSPTITDDGVASGFSAGNYLTANYQIPTDFSELVFKGSFVVGNHTAGTSNLGRQYFNCTNIRAEINTGGTAFAVYVSTGFTVEEGTTPLVISGVTLSPTDTVDYTIEIDKSNLQMSVQYIVNSTTTYRATKTYTGISWKENPIYIPTSAAYWFTGSIDLNSFKIYVDGQEVFNGHKEYIDIIREDNYTVVGTPTISDEGVASGFSKANYLTLPMIFNPSDKTWEIVFKGVTASIDTANAQKYSSLIGTSVVGTDNQGIAMALDVSNKLHLWLSSNGTAWDISNVTSTITFEIGKSYYIKVAYLGDSYIVQRAEDGEDWEDVVAVNKATPIFVSSQKLAIGLNAYSTTEDNSWKGTLDLNSIKITIDGKLVYTPMLRIPYTQAVNGTKIVDSKYADRVTDCFDQFGTANYFILDEVNKQFQLPYDSPTGFNHTLKHYRKGTTSYEYDTNLECVQTGTATANTAVTLPKAYADTNYTVSIACTNKTKTGFTPTVSGDYTTKGRITLA